MKNDLPAKDPSDILGYSITFKGQGMTANIANCSVSGSGLTVVNYTHDSARTVSFKLSGGVDKIPGSVNVTFTTVDNNTINRSFRVPITEL